MDNANNGVAELDVTYIIPILSVSRFEEDHIALEQIFGAAGTTLYPNCRARIVRCSDPSNVLSAIGGTRVPVVICDTDHWEETARKLRGIPEAASVILSTGSADDGRGGDAVKRGVYDVLAKPFRDSEVLRVINMAWLLWQNRYGISSVSPVEAGSSESPLQEKLKTLKPRNPDQSDFTEE